MTPNVIWNPETLTPELERLKPALSSLGMKNPLRRAQVLVDLEENWEDANTQANWDSRISFWRGVLLGEGTGFDLPELVDMGGIEQPARPLSGAGDLSEANWANHMRDKSGLLEHLHDTDFREEMVGSKSWGLYREDGSFDPARAEDLIAGRPRIHDFDPPEMTADDDYDYLIQHPNDRLFQIVHQNNWIFVYLTLAQYHGPDDRWADQFIRMIGAHIDHCPRLPEGHNDFGTGPDPGKPANCAWTHRGYAAVRIAKTLIAYMVMKDSPRFTDRFHTILLRYLVAHVRHVHDLDEQAYSDNYLVHCGKSTFLTGVLLPELRESNGWMSRMWKNFSAGMERELLPDGTHFHRAFGYHCGFIGNPVSMIHLGRQLDSEMTFPERFLVLTENATQSLVSVLTPSFTTPGINDDYTADIVDQRDLIQLSANVFNRDDWRYLVSNGKVGTPPEDLSVLLPDAQLAVMRSDWSRQAHYLLFNISPDGGHHHPDTLSIQIWAGGERLLTEPGTGHYYTGERELSKRSWWHNCPTLGKNMLPNNPSPKVLHWETSRELDYAAGQITVECAKGNAVIRRHIFFINRSYWILFDEFDLASDEEVWENFHFPVEQISVSSSTQVVEIKGKRGTGLQMVAGQNGWQVDVESANRWMMYGNPPESTSVLHYRADPETAAKGFAVLFVPSTDKRSAEARVDTIQNLENGSTRITVTVDGQLQEVTTLCLNLNC